MLLRPFVVEMDCVATFTSISCFVCNPRVAQGRGVAMAPKRKYDAPRLEKAAEKAAVDRAETIKAELQKEEIQNGRSVDFELSCRRVE